MSSRIAKRQLPINFGSQTVNFDGLTFDKTITISTSAVKTNSIIKLDITVPNTRDLDEMAVSFQLAYGKIIDGVSFDIYINNSTEDAEGNYIVNYSILNDI